MSLSNGLLKEGNLKFLDFRSDVTYRNQLIPLRLIFLIKGILFSNLK